MTLDRVEQFRADLADGPAAIRRLIGAWHGDGGLQERVPPIGGRPIRFTGLGSSRFAALVIAAELEAVGTHAPVDWASAPAPGSADEILIAVSSSGRTPEVVEAARRHAARGGIVVAVTTNETSPLAGAAASTLPLPVTPETSGVACTTFRATVLALALATRTTQLPGSADPADELDRTMADVGQVADAWADSLHRADAVDVIGDGRSIGALEQAALMLREGPRIRAHAWDAGDWLHTAVYTALPDHRAILFSGTPYDDEITETIHRRGGAVCAVPEVGGRDPVTAAVVGLAWVEAAAAAVWARATARKGVPP